VKVIGSSVFVVLIALTFATVACSRKQAAESPAASGPLHIAFVSSPDRPSMTKPMAFQVHLADGSGRAVNDAQVNGVVTMKLMDMGATQVPFTAKGNGDYEASVKSLDMSGPWTMEVDARRGGTQSKQSFDFTVFD
jgi:hypothetical protein